MNPTSEAIYHVHTLFKSVPNTFNYAPLSKKLTLGFGHQPFHVYSCCNVKFLLRFKEPFKLLLLQKISGITHEYPFQIDNQFIQSLVVFHISRGKEYILKFPIPVTYTMQLETEKNHPLEVFPLQAISFATRYLYIL